MCYIYKKEENCNCRGKKKTGCVMEGSRCLDKGTVNQAEVTALGKPKEKYVGIAYRNHTFTFAHKEKRKNTKLSGYIWQLKEESLDYNIKWRILARCQPFKASSKSCRLCLREKYILMHHPELASLNARDEFFSGCLHKHSLKTSQTAHWTASAWLKTSFTKQRSKPCLRREQGWRTRWRRTQGS